MAHDGSLASKVEDWIVTTVRGLQFNEADAFAAADVLPWEGTEAATVREFSERFHKGARDRIARVLYVNDQRVEELADAQIKTPLTCLVLIGIKDMGPEGAARRGSVRGETTTWGTNAMRGLLRTAFNQARPNLSDATAATDKCHYMGSEIVVLNPNICVMMTTLVVDEVPKST